MCELRIGWKMAVEAAVNRLEALVEKIDSDLDCAVLKLANEFSENFEEDVPCEINPVRLIERLQKAKKDFKMLMKESDEIGVKQKAISQEICRLTLDEMCKVQKLQLETGMPPSSNTADEEFLILRQECATTENSNYLQDSNAISADFIYGKNSTVSRFASNDFQPVTEEEFMSVSDLVRGRSKLQDVNQVYDVLFTYFQKNRKASALSLKEMTKLGLKVSGATGSAKLKVLRTLNIIEIGKDGSVKML